jgi:segregation and condensation protein B
LNDDNNDDENVNDENVIDHDTALVEAVLYLETEPLDEAAIAAIAALSIEAVDLALGELSARYRSAASGIELLQVGGGIMLSPKKAHWDLLKERYGKKSEGKLSRAALETLSIIAYSQPVTRSEIEAIRGVGADNMIRLLGERGLIHEAGKKDVPGKPAQYGTTPEFLHVFHLSSIANLPKLPETDAERFELQNP